ncbi:hypothetical protein NECAME_14931, partial [Necator americanus]
MGKMAADEKKRYEKEMAAYKAGGSASSPKKAGKARAMKGFKKAREPDISQLKALMFTWTTAMRRQWCECVAVANSTTGNHSYGKIPRMHRMLSNTNDFQDRREFGRGQ